MDTAILLDASFALIVHKHPIDIAISPSIGKVGIKERFFAIDL